MPTLQQLARKVCELSAAYNDVDDLLQELHVVYPHVRQKDILKASLLSLILLSDSNPLAADGLFDRAMKQRIGS